MLETQFWQDLEPDACVEGECDTGGDGSVAEIDEAVDAGQGGGRLRARLDGWWHEQDEVRPFL